MRPPDASVTESNQGAVYIEYEPITGDYFDEVFFGKVCRFVCGVIHRPIIRRVVYRAHQAGLGTGSVFLLE